MNKVTSSYLDGWRIIAASVVLLSHLNDWSGKRLPLFTPALSAQAVLIFFVLSGFVISYVSTRREDDWRAYTISRAARLYSVALPALVFSFLVQAFCAPLPHWIIDDSAATSPVAQFAAGATFLNEVWSRHVQIASNSPYWSMGYEVPFYLAFGLAFFLPGRAKWAGAIVLAVFGPRVALFAPIWLLGAAIQLVCRRGKVGAALGAWLFAGSMLGWIALNILVHRGVIGWNDAPLYWHKARDLPADFLVAILFAGSIVGIDAATRGRSPPLRLKVAVQWLAGATFTLYLFHVPFAQALFSILPLDPANARHLPIIIAAIFGGMLALAELTERRKAFWQRGFAALLTRSPAPQIRR